MIRLAASASDTVVPKFNALILCSLILLNHG
jgi:hypothetical protein